MEDNEKTIQITINCEPIIPTCRPLQVFETLPGTIKTQCIDGGFDMFDNYSTVYIGGVLGGMY